MGQRQKQQWQATMLNIQDAMRQNVRQRLKSCNGNGVASHAGGSCVSTFCSGKASSMTDTSHHPHSFNESYALARPTRPLIQAARKAIADAALKAQGLELATISVAARACSLVVVLGCEDLSCHHSIRHFRQASRPHHSHTCSSRWVAAGCALAESAGCPHQRASHSGTHPMTRTRLLWRCEHLHRTHMPWQRRSCSPCASVTWPWS